MTPSKRPVRGGVTAAGAALALLFAVGCATSARVGQGVVYDVIVRGGTVVDGTGAAMRRGDVAVAGGRIVRVGDLSGARAATEIDATGLLVAPGFINLHSHAEPAGLPHAANVLTQGVTTEILNPDGGGPLDIGGQLDTLAARGLAVNAGAYIGFNSAWASVVGPDDRRPTADEVARMQRLVAAGLEAGAWGVSAGLDYKPAYFATTDEVVRVLEPARRWRTNFANHERVTPESGYSSRAGIAETLAIGARSGLVPVVTHMKVQGREQGSAADILALMEEGGYAAGDVYPYLAGQTSLAALIVPGWAQAGGREAMLRRFADAAQRARIVAEAEEAMGARFGGPEGVYLPGTRRQLVDVMRALGVSAGEAVIRILEQETPTAILRFGAEADLIALLRHPTIAIACDCGASAGRVAHPRQYGTFPRVLGRYVREQRVLSWEEAVRRMTALPAATVGMVDRGFIAAGMAADIVVFDSATVLDHATFEEPDVPSVGIRHVLVNGRIALRDGTPTGVRGGRALRRAGAPPSRPMDAQHGRRVAIARAGVASSADADVAFAGDVVLDVAQAPGERPRGTLLLRDGRGPAFGMTEAGVLQVADGWAALTGVVRSAAGEERAFIAVVETADPLEAGAPTVRVLVDGMPPLAGRLTAPPVLELVRSR